MFDSVEVGVEVDVLYNRIMMSVQSPTNGLSALYDTYLYLFTYSYINGYGS